MNDIGPFLIPLMGIMIPISAIIGAFIYVIVRAVAHARVRELEIRERIAMIERGLVPPPEVDPRGFDRAMNRLERHELRYARGRHRRGGVTLMGVGFGLMLMLSLLTGESAIGLGIGGFLAVFGLALFISGFIEDRHAAEPYPSSPGRPNGAATPSPPPAAVPNEPPRRD